MGKQSAKMMKPKLRFPEFSEQPGFRATTVGQLTKKVSAGGTPDTNEMSYWGGEVWWMNSGELNLKRVYEVQGRITKEGLKNSSTKQVPARSVLIGLAGQGKTRGTVAMNMVPLCINQSIAAIYPSEDAFVSDFLYHNLDGRYVELRGLSTGGVGRGGLNLQIIRSLEVLVPNLAEQQKIADCLTSLDKVIAAQGRKVEALKVHKRGLMQQLFPREGETRPRLRFPEFRDAPEWEPKKLGALLQESLRPVDMEDDAEYSLVTVKRRYGGVVSRGVLKGNAIKVKSQFSVRGNDFLISKRQIVHNACGLVPLELAGAIVSNEYSVLTPKKGCNIRFFSYFSQQPNVSRSFLQSSVGIVIEKMLFKLDAWLKFEFLFPSMQEQKRIAACLMSVEDLLSAEARRLAALRAHKQGLMQQLFPVLASES